MYDSPPEGLPARPHARLARQDIEVHVGVSPDIAKFY